MSDKKPREFWIKNHTFETYMIIESEISRINPKELVYEDFKNAVHVIEYSAYEALKKFHVDFCEQAQEKTDTDIKLMQAEIASLEAERDEYGHKVEEVWDSYQNALSQLREAKAELEDIKERYELACNSDNAWREGAEKTRAHADQLAAGFRELVEQCEWYFDKGLPHERNHFLAVEARGNFYDPIIAEYEKFKEWTTEQK